MKATSFIVELKPYPFEVLFSFNQSDTEFRKELHGLNSCLIDEQFLYEEGKMSNTIHSHSPGYETIVRFTKFKMNAENYGFLAHEIFHVVELIFKSAGIPHSVKYSSEAYAYQIGYITEQVYKKIGIK